MKNKEAVISVEAAIVMPMFLMFFTHLITILLMIHIHSEIQIALHQEVTDAAIKLHAVDRMREKPDQFLTQVLTREYIKEKTLRRIGDNVLEDCLISGGITADLVSQAEENDVDVTLTYEIKPLIPIIPFANYRMYNRCRVKAFNGYERPGSGEGDEDDPCVYITETGEVYHISRNCTHIALSVRSADSSELSSLKNSSGEKYEPCERCSDSAAGSIYITDNGNRYHASLSCSGLKRTVRAVRLSEAGGRRPCSRCAG